MISLKNLKISYKLLFGFIFIIILVGSGGIYMEFTSRQINERVISHAQVIESAQRLIQSTEKSFNLMNQYLLVENTSELELLKPKIADSLFQTHAVIKSLKGQNISEYSLNVIDNYIQIAAQASKNLTYSHDLRLGLESSKKISQVQLDNLKKDERNNLNTIQDAQAKTEGAIESIVKSSQDLFQTTQVFAVQSQYIALGVLIIGVVLAVIISFLLANVILKPIDQLIIVARKVAEGDLTKRSVIQSTDEIGYLSRVFDNMLDNIEVSQKQIKAGEEELKVEKAGVEQKVIERTTQLREEQARLEASINSLNVGFIMTDIAAEVITMNGVAGRMLCLTKNDTEPGGALRGPISLKCDMQTMQNSLDGAFPLIENVKTCLKAQRIIDVKEVNYSGRILHIFIAPIVKLEKTLSVIGSVVLIEDVTEAKMLDRSRDEFFSIASHELRTPLTAIRGNISLIQQFYADKMQEKDLKEMLEDIYESSTRLISIVNDFLDTSRLELGKIQFKNAEFDLVELIRTVTKEYVTTGSMKNLYLKFDEPKIPLPKVYADKDRVKQVMINLVGNALKFTEKGGVTIGIVPEKDTIKVLVTDTGRGISDDSQKLLFRKFQQASASIYTRDTVKGTGLGLYISKLMIEAMGGQIWLEKTEVDKGTTFALSLLVSGSTKALNLQKQEAAKAQVQVPIPAAIQATAQTLALEKPEVQPRPEKKPTAQVKPPVKPVAKPVLKKAV